MKTPHWFRRQRADVSPRHTARRSSFNRIEVLEPRQLLAGAPVISAFTPSGEFTSPVTALRLTLSDPVLGDAARAAGSYQLAHLGADRAIGGGDDQTFALYPRYVDGTQSIELTLTNNLAQWSERDYAFPTGLHGTWQLDANSASVGQSLNGGATMFVSDYVPADGRFGARFRVDDATGDNDYVGVVFGYGEGSEPGHPDHFYLLSWKRATEGVAEGGLKLVRVDAQGQAGARPDLWDLDDENPFIELLAVGPTAGWQPQTDYDAWINHATDGTIGVELRRAVDGQLVWQTTVQDPTPLGRGNVGFYDFSQTGARFTDLSLRSPMPDGYYRLTVASGNPGLRALDGTPLDGNADGTGGDPYFANFSINSFSAAVTIDLQAASDSGLLSDDNLTNDTTPTFDVSVNKIGRVNLDFDGNGTTDVTDLFTAPGTKSYTRSLTTNRSYTARASFVPASGANVENTLDLTIDTRGPAVLPGPIVADAPWSTYALRFDEPIASTSVQQSDVQIAGPAGNVAVIGTTVSDRDLTITFPAQTDAGNYLLRIGPQIADLAGNLMNQDGDGTMGEATADQYVVAVTLGDVPRASFDAARDFSATQNPNGPWTYGWSSALTSGFSVFTSAAKRAAVLDAWYPSAGVEYPWLLYNPTQVAVAAQTYVLGPAELSLHPSSAGAFSTIRWTAPEPGVIRIDTGFEGVDTGGTTSDVHVVVNGAALFGANLSGSGTVSQQRFATTTTVNAGATVDFLVGYGANHNFAGDSTSLDAVVTYIEQPASIVLALTADSDTGVSSTDRLTRDSTPTVAATVNKSGRIDLEYTGDGVVDQSITVTTAGTHELTLASLPDGPRNVLATFVPAIGTAASASLSLQIDTLAPSKLSGSPSEQAPKASRNITFSEPIVATTFVTAQTSISGPGIVGAKPVSNVSGSGASYVVSFDTLLTAGNYELNLPPTISDAAGNLLGPNVRDAFTLIADQTGPLVTSLTPLGVRNTDIAKFTVDFNERISAFPNSAVTILGPGAAPMVTSVVPLDGEGRRFDILLSSPISAEGEYRVTVGPNVLDLSGNAMSGPYAAVTRIDKTGPSILSHGPQGVVSQSLDHIDITFDEPVTFAASTVAVSGPNGTFNGTGLSSGSGNTYRVYFPAQQTAGVYSVTIGTQVFDAVGNLMNPNDPGRQWTFSLAFADLAVLQPNGQTAFGLSAPVEFGTSRTVSWVVRNNAVITALGQWSDRVWLSRNATLERTGADADLLLAERPAVLTPLAADQSYTNTATVALPVSTTLPSGDYYILVETDIGATVFEASEANNVLASASVHIVRPAIPDLVATSPVVPSTAVPGGLMSVTWSVTPTDDELTPDEHWNEEVWASKDARTDTPADDRLLGTFSYSGPLGSVPASRQQSVTVPIIGYSGPMWVYVRADSALQITESDESNNSSLSASPVQVSTALTITLPSLQAREDATNPAIRGVLSRNGDVSSSLVVTMASTDASEITVPLFVTLPAGQASTTFPLDVQADGIVDGNQSATITASATGYSPASVQVTIVDVDVPRLTLSIDASELAEQAITQAMVSADYPAMQDLVVSLAVSSSGQLNLPSSVTIPAGQTSSAPFTIGVVDDTLVETSQTITVTATAAGHVGGSDALRILESDIPNLSLSIPTQVIAEGAPAPAAIGRVSRSILSTRPLVVQLLSSDPTALSVPASVTIPANAASTTFPILAINDSLVDGPQAATITAKALTTGNGTAVEQGSATFTITVTDDDGPTLSITLASQIVAEGGNTTGTVRRNTIANSSPLLVTLSSSDTSEALVPLTILIPAGASQATFPITSPTDLEMDGNISVTILAEADAYNSGATVLTVSDENLPDLRVSSIAAPSVASTGSSVGVNWTIINSGIFSASGTWLQRVFLSTDPVPSGDDLLVDQQTFNSASSAEGPLDVGASFSRTTTFAAPNRVGTYYVLVVADAVEAISEGIETNNFSSSGPLAVNAEYRATVTADVDQALTGTPVRLTGSALNPATGAKLPGVDVSIRLLLRGTRRQFIARTDAAGNYSYLFQPLPGEAGLYQVAADHPGVTNDVIQDTFTLLGMQAEPPQASLRIQEAASAMGQVTIRNLSDVPLIGLTASLVEKPANILVSPPTFVPTTFLDGLGTLSLRFQMSAVDASELQGRVLLRVASAEGITIDIPVQVSVDPLHPMLNATPSTIATGMLRGEQTFVDVVVANTGGKVTGPLSLALPANLPWMRSITPSPLPSLAPGESTTVTLQLTPPADLTLTEYTGNIALNGDGVGLAVPFRIRALSEAVGDLLVTVEDEYTYFAAGSPRVAGATVTVTDTLTGQRVAETTSDASGHAALSGIREGYYDVTVKAAAHNTFRQTLLLLPSDTNALTAFMPRETVTYNWTVTPTEIEDKYSIEVETTFEAVVPAPVVTMEPKIIDFDQMLGDSMQVNIVLTNHGLIAAENVRLELPTHPYYEIKALVTDIGILGARSTITIPVMIRHLTFDEVYGSMLRAAFESGLAASLELAGDVSIPASAPSAPDAPTMIEPDFSDVPKQYLHCVWAAWAGGMMDFYSARSQRHLSNNFPGYRLPSRIKIVVDQTDPQVHGRVYQNDPTTIHLNKQDVMDACDCPQCTLALPGNHPQVVKNWERDCAAEKARHLRSINKAREGLETTIAHETVHVVDIVNNHGVFTDGKGIGCEEKWRPAPTKPKSVDAGKCWEDEMYGEPKFDRPGDPDPNPHFPYIELPCDKPYAVTYEYRCGGLKILRKDTGSMIHMGTCCEGLPSLPSNPVSVQGGSGGSGGGGAYATSIRVVSSSSRQCALPGNSPTDGISSEFGGTLVAASSPSEVCAQVRLRIDQQAIIARDAFDARLELINESEEDIEHLAVSVTVFDALNNDVTGLFGIREPILVGLTGVDGQGQLDNGTTGTANWVLIPTPEAALLESVQYFVGGTLSYLHGGQAVNIALTPAPITVHPSPNLKLKYFHERDVLADDPFTDDVVEPSIPYSLAVLVTNDGNGIAKNMRIVSAQPKIVDNEKGLLVDFVIVGAQVENNPVSPSLTVNFGNIDPHRTKQARWLFTSTLQGLFIDYKATFEHLDGLGDPRLSLIDSVDIHELIRTVQAGGFNSDGTIDSLADFLVNDAPDEADTPDTLHLSDGSVVDVGLGIGSMADGNITDSDLTAQLTVDMPLGWGYIDLPDPGQDRFRIARITREDGSIVPLENAWQTDRTFIGGGRRPIYERRLHLLDKVETAGATTYRLTYVPVGDHGPTIVQISPVMPDPTTVAIATLDVTLSKAIDLTTFDRGDLSLSRDGGENLIQPGVSIAHHSGTTYRISGLANLTALDGEYRLTVNAAGIADEFGTPGVGVATESWTKGEFAPAVDYFSGVPDPVRTESVEFIDVVFNEPIDLSSFGLPDVTLKRNGGSNLLVEGLGFYNILPKTYRVTGLEDLTGSDGNYRFCVNSTGVKDVDGNDGVGTSCIEWTMDNVGPRVLDVVEVANTASAGRLGFLDVLFDQAIAAASFTIGDLTVRRNNSANLVDNQVRIVPISSTVYRVMGLDATSAEPGSYSVSVDATSIEDGGHRTGQAIFTKSFDKSAPPAVTNLSISPAKFVSGAWTSAQRSVTIAGELPQPGLRVEITDETTSQVLIPATIVNAGFALQTPLLSPGTHQLRIRTLDASGNSSSASIIVFVDVAAPVATALRGAPTAPSSQAVTSLEIDFSEPIDLLTLDASDVQLYLNSTRIVLGSDVVIEHVSGATYWISGLGPYTDDQGRYALALEANSVSDVAGNAGNGTIQTNWITTSSDDHVAPRVSRILMRGSSWSQSFLDELAQRGLGSDGYAMVVGSCDQLLDLPWRNIDQVVVEFNEDVFVSAEDLVLEGLNRSIYSVDLDSFQYDPVRHRATWKLSNPIGADRLLLTVSDRVRDLASNRLDGEWSNVIGQYPSGNGVAGGDLRFLFTVLPGDTNRDAAVDRNDVLSTLQRGFSDRSHGVYNPYHDLDTDGIISVNDGVLVRDRSGNTIPTGNIRGQVREAAVANVLLGSTLWTQEQRLGADPAFALGFAVPVGACDQFKTISIAGLDRISLVFTENMLVTAGDLKVFGVSESQYAIAANGFVYDAVKHAATWTLAQPIVADKVLLRLSDTVRSTTGKALDGEWTDSSQLFSSGDGIPGGAFNFRFNVLAGDFNQDGSRNSGDWGPTAAAILKNDVRADVNHDGATNYLDLIFARNQSVQSLPAGEPAPAGSAAASAVVRSARRPVLAASRSDTNESRTVTVETNARTYILSAGRRLAMRGDAQIGARQVDDVFTSTGYANENQILVSARTRQRNR